ncbi:hypothetical protein [Streptosporangium sp. NPDC002721]|uniref:hypothetical protein n=1 Tax=Streptosporangium sp. NPDC002721 TaxID=3366188 RepID=UPI00367B37B1
MKYLVAVVVDYLDGALPCGGKRSAPTTGGPFLEHSFASTRIAVAMLVNYG